PGPAQRATAQPSARRLRWLVVRRITSSRGRGERAIDQTLAAAQWRRAALPILGHQHVARRVGTAVRLVREADRLQRLLLGVKGGGYASTLRQNHVHHAC